MQRVYQEDPLICPEYAHEMRIISFISEMKPIEKILKYLELWEEERSSQLRPSRAPPLPVEEIVYTTIDDDGRHHEMDDLVS